MKVLGDSWSRKIVPWSEEKGIVGCLGDYRECVSGFGGVDSESAAVLKASAELLHLGFVTTQCSVGVTTWDGESLPMAITQLTNLTELTLHERENLVSLPEQFGELCSLKHLDLFGCKRLKELPAGLVPFSFIRPVHCEPTRVTIVKPMVRLLSTGFEKLTSLVKLNLRQCNKLINLGEGLSAHRLPSPCSSAVCVNHCI